MVIGSPWSDSRSFRAACWDWRNAFERELTSDAEKKTNRLLRIHDLGMLGLWTVTERWVRQPWLELAEFAEIRNPSTAFSQLKYQPEVAIELGQVVLISHQQSMHPTNLRKVRYKFGNTDCGHCAKNYVFLQRQQTIFNGIAGWRFNEWKHSSIRQPHRNHLQQQWFKWHTMDFCGRIFL